MNIADKSFDRCFHLSNGCGWGWGHVSAFIHLSGTWSGKTQKPGHRNTGAFPSLFCFSVGSVQHGGFRVGRILNRWLKAPKANVLREKERQAEAISPFMTLLWEARQCHFCCITLVGEVKKVYPGSCEEGECEPCFLMEKCQYGIVRRTSWMEYLHSPMFGKLNLSHCLFFLLSSFHSVYCLFRSLEYNPCKGRTFNCLLCCQSIFFTLKIND